MLTITIIIQLKLLAYLMIYRLNYSLISQPSSESKELSSEFSL